MAGEPWEQAKTSLQGVAEIAAQYDDDGIDIYFLNSKRVGTELRTAADVEELFEGLVPKGATPTGSRLDAILQKYLSRLEKAKTYDEQIKPLNLIIVTDGYSASSDDPEVVLVAAAQRLDRGEFPSAQVGVQFLQIGGTAEAHEALQVLDDGLHQVHDVRDIVDTVMFTGETVTASYLIKTLLGGINKRLDQT
ncbi:hypothetical protein BD324DRAFT_578764 [Kockovaella imperatae]|uniref:VWFA domain-containing protein n=1 Tax=Kockovaella imperatae TaxID=4999 RepID=A0A1Y1UJY1_9TREE|nr:hypothetical protein BD324DRAFT_578764 [Kockovaella imperatae]ORX37776.1 hypothetical protein BD324DRAFT_578764 [Kockovaella imperatae]